MAAVATVGSAFARQATVVNGYTAVVAPHCFVTAWQKELERERTIKSGWLEKRGEKRNRWKRRWFVLRSTRFAYYKDEGEYSPLGILRVSDIHSVSATAYSPSRQHVLAIVTRQRTYYLEALGEYELLGWIKAFYVVMQNLRHFTSHLNLASITDDSPLQNDEDRQHLSRAVLSATAPLEDAHIDMHTDSDTNERQPALHIDTVSTPHASLNITQYNYNPSSTSIAMNPTVSTNAKVNSNFNVNNDSSGNSSNGLSISIPSVLRHIDFAEFTNSSSYQIGHTPDPRDNASNFNVFERGLSSALPTPLNMSFNTFTPENNTTMITDDGDDGSTSEGDCGPRTDGEVEGEDVDSDQDVNNSINLPQHTNRHVRFVGASGSPLSLEVLPVLTTTTSHTNMTLPLSNPINLDSSLNASLLLQQKLQPHSVDVPTTLTDNAYSLIQKQMVHKSGWILKHGKGTVKKWKKRWCVLRQDTLIMFKDEKEYVPLRVIQLISVIDTLTADPPRSLERYLHVAAKNSHSHSSPASSSLWTSGLPTDPFSSTSHSNASTPYGSPLIPSQFMSPSTPSTTNTSTFTSPQILSIRSTSFPLSAVIPTINSTIHVHHSRQLTTSPPPLETSQVSRHQGHTPSSPLFIPTPVANTPPLQSDAHAAQPSSNTKWHVLDATPHCFQVVTPRRTFIFAAESTDEKANWVREIKRLSRALRG